MKFDENEVKTQTCCSVDLSCQKQSFDLLRFQRWIKFTRIYKVIFNSIARSDKISVFKSGKTFDKFYLKLFRKRAWQSVGVNDVVVKAFRFQPNLMRLFAESENFKLKVCNFCWFSCSNLSYFSTRSMDNIWDLWSVAKFHEIKVQFLLFSVLTSSMTWRFKWRLSLTIALTASPVCVM